MKRLPVIVAILLCASLASAQAASGNAKGKSAAPMTHEARIVTPDKLMWSPLVPGIEMAVVQGNPNGAGHFVIRLRGAEAAKIPPHWHPTDEYVTVLSGDARVGMGKTWDDAQLKEAAPIHTSVLLPAHMPHFAQMTKGTEVEVSGAGPFVINYVNPADDPNKKK